MRRRFRMTAIAAALLLLPAGCSAEPPAPAASRQLVWSDEFDGTAGTLPDARSWDFETGGAGWGNRELECYTDVPGNTSLDGRGDLVITAIRQPGHVCSDGNRNDYTSGKITTQNTFQAMYGSLEIRARLPAGTGAWPAFWAQGTDITEVGWPASGEIDVFEAKGGRHTSVDGAVYGSVHAPLADSSPTYLTVERNTAIDLSADFHTYAVDWSPTGLVYSIDGEPYGTITKQQVLDRGATWVFDKPFYLLVNLAVGGNFTDTPTTDFGPSQQYTVDYVRVYR